MKAPKIEKPKKRVFCDEVAIGHQSDANVSQDVCEKHACEGLKGMKPGEIRTGVTVYLKRFEVGA